MNFVYHEVMQVKKTGPDSSKCNCILIRTYGLPSACLISKMKLDKPICMDEVYTYWKILRFDDDDVVKESKSTIHIMTG